VTRAAWISRLAIGLTVATLSCKDAPTSSTIPPSQYLPARTFRMGFSAFPPRPTNEAALATIDVWSRRADAAIIHNSVPYQALLSGTNAATYVNTVDLPLANIYKAKGLQLAITVDVTDGLNRAAEDPALVALKRSIAEPAVQLAYRQYVQALVSAIRPEYLGLAAETNLIRGQAPAAVYSAMVQMTNAAASDVKALGGKQPVLYASVQADFAWGPPPAAYKGVEQDFRDFPFVQAIAISSYPYFVYPDPDQIPLDYYTRLAAGRTLPILVVEGGWTSASVGQIQSSAAKQARYVRRHEKLLDSAKAVAVFQLTFTDLDLSSLQVPPGSNLPLFASLGFVDANLSPKAVLATHDSVFMRPLKK